MSQQTRTPPPPRNGTAPPQPPQGARRMTLAAIHRGPRQVPDRVLLMGTEGIGKSTFAASAPSPVFIATEEGTHHLDVASFPLATSYRDVMDALDVLATQDHPYRTCVVDTLDALEPLVWRETCRRNNWGSIDEPEFQKGYAAAVQDWRQVLAALERVQQRGLEVILIAHVAVRNFKNPTGPDYDRYEAKLHKHAAALVREWVFAALFAAPVEYAEKVKGGAKHKGLSDGRRVIHTTRTAAWDAKNRWNLPDTLPLEYAEYAAARAAGSQQDQAALRAEIARLVEQLGAAPETRAAIDEKVAACADNATALARLAALLRQKIDEKGNTPEPTMPAQQEGS